MLQNYVLPESVVEVINILDSSNGQARVISGGTDLLLDISGGKIKTGCLVDISRILELGKITLEDGVINIGAAVTHNQVAGSELIRERAPVLAMAARKVGSLQVRNSGTVVGNVVNAQPAADTAVALVALGAVAEIVSASGVENVPVEKLYAGVGKSTVDSTAQLVTRIKFPAHLDNQSSAFIRLEQRKALALPMLNIGVMISLAGNKFEWSRIVVAPVGPGPLRAGEAEELLNGAEVSPESINNAANAVLSSANPRSSALRGSREYRLAVLPALVKRALNMAVNQVVR